VGENDVFNVAGIGTESSALTAAVVADFTDTASVTPASDLTASIDWGDGTAQDAPVTGGGGSFQVTGQHTYATPAQYTVSVTLRDDTPGTATATAKTLVDISPALQGQVVLSGVTEHVPLTGTVATFTEGNGTDPASAFTASIDWGDGTATAGTVSAVSAGSFAVAGSHTYADEGSDPITVTIVDTNINGAQLTLNGTVLVAENDVLSASGTALAGTVGQALTAVVGSFTDGDTVTPADDLAATIDWGDNTQTPGTVSGGDGAFTVSGTHAYAATGSYTITTTLQDDAPGTASATASSSVLVLNAGGLTGQVTLGAATEHVPLAQTVATFTDSNSADQASGFTASINWGDGTTTVGQVTGGKGSFAVSGSHVYADEGTAPLAVTITHTADGTAITPKGTVVVGENDVLTPHALTISVAPGKPFSGALATFTDSDTISTPTDFAATINWGDGTTSSGTVSGGNGSFSVSGTHTYASTAVFTTIDAPGEAQTQLWGINNHREIVGADLDEPEGVGGPVHSFILNTGNFDVGPLDLSTAISVNQSGTIAGGYFNGTVGEGYVGGPGNTRTISASSGSTNATGIDDAGMIVGMTGNPEQAFVDVGGNISTINLPGSANWIAISANGTLAISYGSSTVVGTLGNLQPVNLPAGAIVQGINDLGQLVGYDGNNGFLYSGGNAFQIAVPGAQRTIAEGINDSGEIVGTYVDASGNEHGFTTTAGSAQGAYTAVVTLSDDGPGTAVAVASVPVSVDSDTGEQAALKLTITGTTIGSATASALPFTIAGLDPEDTGVVTFTDPNGKTVPVSVSGGQTSYTANLTTLADGTVTSSLAVNADSAGNSFTPVAGPSVTLDQDLAEQAALKLAVGVTTIGAAAASAVPFTIAGLDPEDTGVVTFTDANGKTVQVPVSGGKPGYTANLSTLADGIITSSLAVNTDAAGNSFTPVAGTTTATPVVINFDSLNLTGVSAFDPDGGGSFIPALAGQALTNYFAAYGISYATSAGSTLAVINNSNVYNSAQVTTNSSGNMLFEFGNENGETYDLNFANPLASISLELVGFKGALVPQWSITAYDKSGNIVGTVGQPLGANFAATPQLFTINAAGTDYITRVEVFGDGFDTAAYENPLFDKIILDPAQGSVTLDQDAGEQAALKLTVGMSNIGAAAASAVPFSIAGLDPEDTGTVTFTDTNGNTVKVNVDGAQTSYFANLTTLADGHITSSLAVNTDAAGNSFTAVPGTAVTLDTDKGVSPVLAFVSSVVDAAADSAWPVTISGLDDETGTLSFTDTSGHKVSVNVTGNGTYSVNLSSLVAGPVASNLSLSDPVGNHWSLAGAALTLIGTHLSGSTSVRLPPTSTGNLGKVGSNGPTVIDASQTHGITFQSGNGVDTIIAGPNDTVLAGSGPDTLIGATGATLEAGTGPQTLYGAPGETMVGSSGPDTFAFEPGFGHDTVVNFHSGNDVLRFNPSLLANFAAAMADAKQIGVNTVLTIDPDDSVTLQNVNLTSLSSSNFHFA
jgi:hypothetical protein